VPWTWNEVILALVEQAHFVYDQSVEYTHPTDERASGIAAAIGDPGRARMLYCLMDGHARTSTELALVAQVSPSTASVHLQRLKTARLVRVKAQGKHRYYSLNGAEAARVLEALNVLAGSPRTKFRPNTPVHLRAARTCYDHLAGRVAVALHDRMKTLGYLQPRKMANGISYELTIRGMKAFESLGIDVSDVRKQRRKFAFACLDWSERTPHLGGSLGAALLQMALKRKWLARDDSSRAVSVTILGRREMRARFGIETGDCIGKPI